MSLEVEVRIGTEGGKFDTLLATLQIEEIPRVGEYLWFTDGRREGHTSWRVIDVAHWVAGSHLYHRVCVYVEPTRSGKLERCCGGYPEEGDRYFSSGAEAHDDSAEEGLHRGRAGALGGEMSVLDDRKTLLREVDRILRDSENGAEVTLAEVRILRVWAERYPDESKLRLPELQRFLERLDGVLTLTITVREAKTLRTVLENALILEMENGDNWLIGCEYRAVEGILRKLKELEG